VSDDTPTNGGGGAGKKGPLRRGLDMCVFAPVGMALTIAEDLPDYVDKGRRRVQLQLGNARVVGRFVVTQGQRELSGRLDEVFHGSDNDDHTDRVDDRHDHDHNAGNSHDLHDVGRRPNGGLPEPVVVPRPQTPLDPAAVAIVEHALADYDTLSASQVVRRLENLGPEELHAVQRYEAATRNRRTILHRASQLLDEGPSTSTAASD
jgi:hypothetical protein